MTKDDLKPLRPRFTTEISFGHMVQIIILAFAVGGGWIKLQEQQAQQEAQSALALEERASLEVRIRALETQSARADERFSSILSFLARIDSRLERIERGQ